MTYPKTPKTSKNIFILTPPVFILIYLYMPLQYSTLHTDFNGKTGKKGLKFFKLLFKQAFSYQKGGDGSAFGEQSHLVGGYAFGYEHGSNINRNPDCPGKEKNN